MLNLEIKIWLGLFLLAMTAPSWFLVKWISIYSFRFVKKFRDKIQHRKNLQDMKQKLLNKDKEEEESEIELEPEKKPNQEKINFKMEKIKIESLAYKERGDIDNYEKKLIEGLALDDNNLEFIRMLGDLYFNIGSTTKSLPLLKKVIEFDSEDHKTIWQIGQIYFDKGDIDTARLLIDKAIQLKSDNPKYYVTLADIMYNSDDIQKAIVLMERAVKLRPNNTNYLIATAALYEDVQDAQNARKYYFKVLEIEPGNEIARKKLSEI